MNKFKTEFEEVIKSAFPNGVMVDYVSHFDNDSFGWNICPKIGTEVRVQIPFRTYNDAPYVTITVFVTMTHGEPECRAKRIFSGSVPAINAGYDFDYGFIAGVLRNWKSFSN